MSELNKRSKYRFLRYLRAKPAETQRVAKSNAVSHKQYYTICKINYSKCHFQNRFHLLVYEKCAGWSNRLYNLLCQHTELILFKYKNGWPVQESGSVVKAVMLLWSTGRLLPPTALLRLAPPCLWTQTASAGPWLWVSRLAFWLRIG